MSVNLILAADRDGIIGVDGKLPWRHPEDLAFFRRTTMGRMVIMGRKTCESLPKRLDGRFVVAITKSGKYPANADAHCGSLQAAYEWHKMMIDANPWAAEQSPMFVAGGAEVYAEALATLPISRVYLTLITEHVRLDTTDATRIDLSQFFDQSKWHGATLYDCPAYTRYLLTTTTTP
jgi:dihydrofolate reductase